MSNEQQFIEQKGLLESIKAAFKNADNQFNCNPNSIAITHNQRKIVPEPRKFSDMLPVLLYPKSIRDSYIYAYYMYRGIEQKGNIRYDITVIPGLKIGHELNKTLGHYHPLANIEKKLSYPEVYQVLNGYATYVLQHVPEPGAEVDFVKIVDAKAGDIVYIQPNFGHVTVNPRSDLLIMSNLVDCSFKSDYSKYVERKGAAVYVTTDGITKNNNYPANVQVMRISANEHEKHFIKKVFGKENDILYSLLYSYDKLNFLTAPF